MGGSAAGQKVTKHKMKQALLLLASCALQAEGATTQFFCRVTEAVIKCDTRCDVAHANASKPLIGNSNPPPGTLLPPSATAVEAATLNLLSQVESDTVPTPFNHVVEATENRAPPPSAMPGAVPIMMELEATSGQQPPAQGGSPTASTGVSDSDFTNTTAYVPVHQALTVNELLEHIGDPGRIEWAPYSKLSFACIDGRYSNGYVYAEGGDMGELLLAMTVYEQMTTKALTQEEVSKMFADYIAHSPKEKFHFCTTQPAIDQLTEAVAAPILDIFNPSEEYKSSLMHRVAAPEFVGGDHIKMMLQTPDKYAVRKGLIENLIRAFFTIMWNEYNPLRAKLELHVLKGEHVERAIIKMRTKEWCIGQQGLAPLIPARTPVTSAFITDPDVLGYARSQLADWFANHVDPPIHGEEMRQRMRTLGTGQAQLTRKAMSGMLRAYTVTLIYKYTYSRHAAGARNESEAERLVVQ